MHGKAFRSSATVERKARNDGLGTATTDLGVAFCGSQLPRKLPNPAQKSLVDGLCAMCPHRADAASGSDGYAKAERRLVLFSHEISALFGYPDKWFGRSRNRQQLYAQGFPRPKFRGRWSREEVYAWFRAYRPGKLPIN